MLFELFLNILSQNEEGAFGGSGLNLRVVFKEPGGIPGEFFIDKGECACYNPEDQFGGLPRSVLLPAAGHFLSRKENTMAAITKAWVKNTSRIAADGVVAIASSLDDMGLPFVEYDYCFRLL